MASSVSHADTFQSVRYRSERAAYLHRGTSPGVGYLVANPSSQATGTPTAMRVDLR